jgi:hypothetical protein
VWDLEDILSSGDELVGQRIFVRGPLSKGLYAETLLRCRSGRCCNRGAGFVELRVPIECKPTPDGPQICPNDAAHTLNLDNLTCVGDDSLRCCPSDAHGQSVVATGILRKDQGPGGGYHMSNVAICARSTDRPGMPSP